SFWLVMIVLIALSGRQSKLRTTASVCGAPGGPSFPTALSRGAERTPASLRTVSAPSSHPASPEPRLPPLHAQTNARAKKPIRPGEAFRPPRSSLVIPPSSEKSMTSHTESWIDSHRSVYDQPHPLSLVRDQEAPGNHRHHGRRRGAGACERRARGLRARLRNAHQRVGLRQRP